MRFSLVPITPSRAVLASARWQIIGAIVAAEQFQPVAWLARDLGANRQNVQRIVNDLIRDGLVTFAPNPHHKRAQHVVLTDKGRQAYDAAMQLYEPRAVALADGLSHRHTDCQKVVAAMKDRLEKANSGE